MFVTTRYYTNGTTDEDRNAATMVVNIPAHKMHLYYHTWEPHATGIPEILAEKKQKSRINLLFRGIKRVPCLAFSAINTFSFGKGASIHDIVAKIKIKKGLSHL